MAPVRADDAAASEFFRKNELTVRAIDVDHLEEELKRLNPICTAAFAQSPLYTAISREGFVSKLIGLKPLLSGGLTKIVFGRNGEPVAFALCLPDVFDRSGKTFVLKTAAKHPECNIPGVMPELYRLTMAEASARGYEHVIHAFMHADNKSLRRSNEYEGVTIRHYTLYIRPC